MEFKHISVLLEETIENLNIRPDGIYVDGTLGGGGHSYHIAKELSESGRLIGIDQDDAAIAAAGQRLSAFEERVTIVRSNYKDADKALKELSISGVDGIVLDLGVSSYQLDTWREDFPINMIQHWTCVWTEDKPLQQRILSIRIPSRSFLVSFGIMERISLPRILQSILWQQEKRSRLRQRDS